MRRRSTSGAPVSGALLRQHSNSIVLPLSLLTANNAAGINFCPETLSVFWFGQMSVGSVCTSLSENNLLLRLGLWGARPTGSASPYLSQLTRNPGLLHDNTLSWSIFSQVHSSIVHSCLQSIKFHKALQEIPGDAVLEPTENQILTTWYCGYPGERNCINVGIACSILRTFKNLSTLVIIGAKLSAWEMRILGEELKLHSITSLVLSDCCPASEQAEAVIRSLLSGLEDHPTLTYLDISQNNLTSSATKHIKTLLEANSTLQYLVLNGNNFGEEGLTVLKEGVKNNTSLIHLNLKDCHIPPISVKKYDGLVHLKGLTINWEDPTHRGDSDILPLFNFLAISRLQYINLGGSTFEGSFCECLLKNSNLTSVNLSQCQLGDPCAEILFNTLKGNYSLISLCLASNKFGPLSGSVIGEALQMNTVLRILNLEDNLLGDGGLKGLTLGLQNKTLFSLNINRNALTKGACADFLKALHENTTLQFLYMESDQLSGVEALCNVIKQTNLSYLFLGKNDTANCKTVDNQLQFSSTLVDLCGLKGLHRLQIAWDDIMSITGLHFDLDLPDPDGVEHCFMECIRSKEWKRMLLLCGAILSKKQYTPFPAIGHSECSRILQYVVSKIDDQCYEIVLAPMKMRVLDCGMLQPSECRMIVHSLLQITKAEGKGTAASAMLSELARGLFISNNFEALREMALARAMRSMCVDLSLLGLAEVPQNMATLLSSCREIDLSYNKLDTLPRALCTVSNIKLDGNPLGKIPFHFHSWNLLKRFLRLDGEPIPWLQRKLLMIGDGAVGKTSLLSCLQHHKSKTDTKRASIATDGIAVHSEFKLNDTLIWTAWDLGYSSIFLLLFDLALASSPQERISEHVFHNISYWVKQIRASAATSRTSTVDTAKTHVVLVGTHMDQLEDPDAAGIILCKLWTQHKNFSAAFAISLKDGTGIKHIPAEGTTKNADFKLEPTTDSVSSISSILSQLASAQLNVPASWGVLSRKLKRKRKPTIDWDAFRKLARKCKVGVSCTQEMASEEEILMCADFFADSGLIIHFRNSVTTEEQLCLDAAACTAAIGGGLRQKSGRSTQLADMVILQPNWLSGVLTCIVTISGADRWMKNGFINASNLTKVFEGKFPESTHVALVQLLSDFEVFFKMPDGRILVPSLLSEKTLTIVPADHPVEKVVTPDTKPSPSSVISDEMDALLGSALGAGNLIGGTLLTSAVSAIPHIPEISGPLPTKIATEPQFDEQAGQAGYELMQTESNVSGRIFVFGFLPIGFFSRLTARILGIPAIQPVVLCRLQICFMLKTEAGTEYGVVASDNVSTVFIYTWHLTSNVTKESSELFVLIVDTISAFVRSFYQGLWDSATQKISCPHCLSAVTEKKCILSSTFGMDCIEAVKKGYGRLFCPKMASSLDVSSAPEINVATATPPSRSCLTSSALVRIMPAATISVAKAAPDIAMVNLPLVNYDDIVFDQSGSPIGEGGFGKVMKGVWHGLPVAIKEPKLQDWSRVTEFLYEANIMKSLPPHSNIVQFFGVCVHPKILLVMEFISPSIPLTMSNILNNKKLSKPDFVCLLSTLCSLSPTSVPDVYYLPDSGQAPGGRRVSLSLSLPQEVERRKALVTREEALLDMKRLWLREAFPEKLQMKILADVAFGLEHLHGQSPPLVHQDLHAGNVFICSLDPEGSGPWAKIADFGLSQYLYGGCAKTNTGCRYDVFAPEVLAGTKFDSSADVWSYGMLCNLTIDPFSSPFSHLLGNPTYSKSITTEGVTQVTLLETAVKTDLITGKIGPDTPRSNENCKWRCPTWAAEIMQLTWAHQPNSRPDARLLASKMKKLLTSGSL
ncbi:leucinerich repeat kinase [Pelomyxa schiedti]|nr:leucinerich repeat kinase [Pelomyxa schiedti]